MGKFHPLQPAYLADPYPYLARLRATEPLYYSPEMQGYILTRYEHCAAVLRDDEHFSSDPEVECGGIGDSVRRARARAPLGDAPILANCDGETHRRLRAVLAGAFRARTVAADREQIERFVGQAVAAMAPGKPVELMKQLAEPAPLVVLLEYLGVPPAERSAFRECVVGIMRARMDGETAVRDAESHPALRQLRAVVSRSAESSGVLAELAAVASEGSLSEGEMLMLLVHVATAGNAATAFGIGNALLAFATHPEQWAALRADRNLLPAAIEECLRFDSPTHVTSRYALPGAMLGEKRIPPGRALHVVVSAAHRDPAAFEDPDVFDIRRARERQLAFGLGPHVCLGAALGRLDLEVVLTALLERFEALPLASNGYEPGGTLLLRGPRRLTVVPVAAN